jgi:SlyX protein
MNERLAELETRIAFQDRTIQELNDVVVRQQRELERLAREFAALTVQVRALAPYPVASRDEETPPPHY